MSKIVGCKTETIFNTFKINHQYFKEIVRQDWWLSATKGWKRGAKSKTVKQINAYDFYPRVYSKVTFK